MQGTRVNRGLTSLQNEASDEGVNKKSCTSLALLRSPSRCRPNWVTCFHGNAQSDALVRMRWVWALSWQPLRCEVRRRSPYKATVTVCVTPHIYRLSNLIIHVSQNLPIYVDRIHHIEDLFS